MDKALSKLHLFAWYTAHAACVEPLPQDTRFEHGDWQRWPFNSYYRHFWATSSCDATSPRTAQRVAALRVGGDFCDAAVAGQIALSNFVAANPAALTKTMRNGGANLLQGLQYWWDDAERLAGGRRPEGIEADTPGRNVARKPGKVAFRNRLLELIQYVPAPMTVRPEAVLIVPSWHICGGFISATILPRGVANSMAGPSR